MENTIIDEIVFGASFAGTGIYLVWVAFLIFWGKDRVEQGAPMTVSKIERLFVLVPALNEEVVIAQTIKRFLTSTETLPQIKMIIVDDASSDKTVQVARETIAQAGCFERVWLWRRFLPDAQIGKGEALNWAYQKLATSFKKNDHIVCGVLDADAYIGRAGYERILEIFDQDSQIDLLQIRVGMFKKQNYLQKLQDIEFIVINNWIQNIRNRLKNAAASGNGQFIRMQAIDSMKPWGNALLEDFEFSTRFLLQAKKTRYAPDVIVYQEAISKVQPFIRQRARWAQGGLDCLFSYWPKIVGSKDLSFLAKLEMSFYLFLPFFSLVTGLANLAVLGFVLGFIEQYWLVLIVLLLTNGIINSYILWLYAKKTGNLSVRQAIDIFLMMLVYNYLFYVAIIIAFYKKVRGKNRWVKTAHLGGEET